MEEGLRLAATSMASVFASMWFLMLLMYGTVWFFRFVGHHGPEPPSLRSHSIAHAPAPEPAAEILHESEARAAAAVAIAAVLAHRRTRRAR